MSSIETSSLLRIDAAAEVENICASMRRQVGSELKRRGVVLGLSGGIDSSVCAALAARALGPTRVVGILMPEKESSDDSRSLAELLAAQLNIRTDCRRHHASAGSGRMLSTPRRRHPFGHP